MPYLHCHLRGDLPWLGGHAEYAAPLLCLLRADFKAHLHPLHLPANAQQQVRALSLPSRA